VDKTNSVNYSRIRVRGRPLIFPPDSSFHLRCLHSPRAGAIVPAGTRTSARSTGTLRNALGDRLVAVEVPGRQHEELAGASAPGPPRSASSREG
jgi:hypothetical protein